MKNTFTKMIMALVLGASMMMFTACGGSNSGSDANQSTTTTDNGQVFPTCTITQGVPLTDTQITVHVVCTGGNVNIDQATVTVDGQLKNLDFTGANIDDYIGFTNLDDDTVYTVVLKAIVDGQEITKSIEVFTQKGVVNVAPIAQAGANKSIEVGHAVSITGSGTDTDGKIVAYEWKEGSRVLGNTAVISYTPSTVGAHTLTLTVTDDDGATGTDTMVVTATATPTSTPTIYMAVQKIRTRVDLLGNGKVIVYPSSLAAPTVTSVVAGAVYSIVGNPTGGRLTIDATTGVATWLSDSSGSYNRYEKFSITIKVVNPDGGTAETTFGLLVEVVFSV